MINFAMFNLVIMGKKNIFIKPEIKEVFIQKLKIDKIDKNKIDECFYN